MWAIAIVQSDRGRASRLSWRVQGAQYPAALGSKLLIGRHAQGRCRRGFAQEGIHGRHGLWAQLNLPPIAL